MIRRLLALGMLAVVAGGCGGSSYQGLTKADFITQADTICTQTQKDEQAAVKDVPNTATTEEQAQVVLDKIFPLIDDQQKKLRALKPPKEDRATIDALFDEVDRATAAAKQKIKDDPKSVADANYNPYDKANTQAKAYGLKICGQ
jgi:hypothetical protein